jgi:hypothetical protein
MNTRARSFAGIYARKLRRPSRFIWTKESLSIIVRGLFQFHRCGPHRVSLDVIAPHLRNLIREHIKSVVCESHSNPSWAEEHFERICARWIRLPSLRSVLSKLRLCDGFASLVASSEATYESLYADGVISTSIYSAFEYDISRFYHSHSGCYLHTLPAIPRPCAHPSFGSCFYCGSGITDKIDMNLLPKCSCNDDICVTVCSLCEEGVGGIREW